MCIVMCIYAHPNCVSHVVVPCHFGLIQLTKFAYPPPAVKCQPQQSKFDHAEKSKPTNLDPSKVTKVCDEMGGKKAGRWARLLSLDRSQTMARKQGYFGRSINEKVKSSKDCNIVKSKFYWDTIMYTINSVVKIGTDLIG